MAQHVLDELSGRLAAVLDCGPCAGGVESAGLDLGAASPALLRPGGATLEGVEGIIGPVRQVGDTHGVVRSPGMLASHYAPALPVRLNATDTRSDEALLAFGPPRPGAEIVYCLS